MTGLGSQLRSFFEETTEPLTVEEIVDRRTVVVGDESGGQGSSKHSDGPTWWRGPGLAAAVAVMAVVAFVAVASLLAGPDMDVGGADAADAAAQAIEELHQAVSERDTTAVEAFFGEDVVLTSYLDVDFVGPDAVAWIMRMSVPMTIEDISEPVWNDDGSFTVVVLALAETHRYPEAWIYHVFMDGDEVVRVDLESVDPVTS